MEESFDCPKCGYPAKGQYLGIYKPGSVCSGCGYIDHVASASLKASADIKRAETEAYKKQIEDFNKDRPKSFQRSR